MSIDRCMPEIVNSGLLVFGWLRPIASPAGLPWADPLRRVRVCPIQYSTVIISWFARGGLVVLAILHDTINPQANGESRHVLLAIRITQDGKRAGRNIVSAYIDPCTQRSDTVIQRRVAQVGFIVVGCHIRQGITPTVGERTRDPADYHAAAIFVADCRAINLLTCSSVPVAVRGENREVALAGILHRVGGP